MNRVLTAAVSLAAVCGSAVLASPAVAGQSPFSDPAQNGLITLCNAQGHPMTGGDIRTSPFLLRALSSTTAPKGYESGLATLYAYQPIQYVDPGNWSGYQLSGSTYYSNPANPAAEMTSGDGPLVQFTSAYPLHWNGLVQLRLYYTARYTPQYAGGYPAAVIRVSGNRWSAVEVGHTPCNATRTKTFESLVLKKKQYDPAGFASRAKNASGSGSHDGSAANSAAARSADAAAAAAARPDAGSADGRYGSTGGWAAAIAAALLVLAAGAAFWLRRRRSDGDIA